MSSRRQDLIDQLYEAANDILIRGRSQICSIREKSMATKAAAKCASSIAQLEALEKHDDDKFEG